jgi:tripartite ATP-independent transporter DctM subunit
LSDFTLGVLLIGLLFLLLSIGLEVALSLGLVGVLGLLWLKGWKIGMTVIGSICWSTASNFNYVALPLFIFMSAILLHSGIGASLYTAVTRWVSFLPGGLAIASVFACAIFGAVCGSSVATAATIGLIAIPEMEKRGYERKLIYGSMAAGGTLGILIPPSIPMIIYGVMTETSVGQLYIAGIIPGILLSLMFSAYIVILCTLRPHYAPREGTESFSWGDRLRSLAEAAPMAGLIFIVLGTMYLGVVTPTEAAGLGAFASLVLSALYRRLSWKTLVDAFRDTVLPTSMVMLIIIFASIFSHVIALIGAPKAIFQLITDLRLSPAAVFGVIFLLLIVIAYALEELSVMIIMLPFLFPLVTGLGFDPVWFGVVLVVWLEMGFITPPVGINLFVIQGVAKGGTMRDIALGATPYVVMMILFVGILFLFPDLALWLPKQMAPGR